MLRLSFIVPFYNVEPYIEECIRSLYNQDIPMEEYEVICVDDCSPDGSRAIVERLQKEYPTLKLLCHTENKRQGGARNTGMREAQGKYIWFVDSDDYIKPNCLKGLLEIVEKEDLDILDFDFDADYSKQQFRKNNESYEMGPCTGTDYVFSQRQGHWSWRCVCVWGGVIKRSLICDMLFREKVQYEDNDYAIRMYARAGRVHHIPDRPYYYRVVEQSTVNAKPDIRQLEYDLSLIKEYVRLLRLNQWNDCRWQKGVKELLNYSANELYDKLMNISYEEKKMFYTHIMKYIPSTWQWMNKKLWFRLIFSIF